MTLPWTTLDSRPTPDGLLELRRRGEDDFLICLDGRILMNSRASRSERSLGELACKPLAGRNAPHVLIGGLGMGLTLRAALDVLPPRARVAVAELNPVVLEWCRGPLAELNGSCTEDPRVAVVLDDVVRVIKAGGPLDAIVLDLYEGPHAGNHPQDDPCYGSRAVARMRAALRTGGILAVWSEDRDTGFEERLAKAGFQVQQHRPGRGGRRHAVTVGTASG